MLSTVIGIVAQRLVRVNCPHCSEAYAASPEEAAGLGVRIEDLAGHPLRRGAGCLNCRQTGYAGRDGILQLMPITERIRSLVARQASSPDIVETARREGMRTLREAAIEKVLAGVTSVAELLRVTGK